MAEHIDERAPIAGGAVPAVESTDISSRIEKALLDWAVDQAWDKPAAIDGNVIPGIAR
jgi:hypothetical protein